MSTRSRRGRGRPPKTPLSHKSNLLKKPEKPKSMLLPMLDSDGSGSGSSTPVGSRSASSTPTLRTSSRINETKTKTTRILMHKVLAASRVGYEDSDEDSHIDEDDEILPPEPALGEETDFDDDVDEVDSDFTAEADDDVASIYSEASFSTVGSTPRRPWPRRPRTPEFIDEKDIPALDLPTSSSDLIIEKDLVLKALSIYEVIRHFRRILRLSPYRYEDFCQALKSDEQSCLLAETHCCIMRWLQKEEESNTTTFGPQDLKDSINVSMYFLDAMAWPEVVRAYLDSDRSAEFRRALPALERPDYCSTTVEERLQILQVLTDLFLTCNTVREDIMNEGNIQYDDHCRACHRCVSFIILYVSTGYWLFFPSGYYL